MKLIGKSFRPMPPFAVPMEQVRIGLFSCERWQLGRLRYARVGLGLGRRMDLAVSVHEEPDGHLPMLQPTPHMNLHIGPAVIRVI